MELLVPRALLLLVVISRGVVLHHYWLSYRVLFQIVRQLELLNKKKQ